MRRTSGDRLRLRILSSAVLVLWPAIPLRASHAQLAPNCVQDSPERRGQAGCSIIADRLLPDHPTLPLFWHIDRFETLDRARGAAGPAGVAFEGRGTAWLVTVEGDTLDHHGGRHVTQVGPLQLPRAPRLAMHVLAAAFTPGMYSVVHHHSGVEAIYVVEGEACYETSTQGFRRAKGESLMIPARTLHRATVAGSGLRYVLAVIVHDSSQPPTTRMSGTSQPRLAACRPA